MINHTSTCICLWNRDVTDIGYFDMKMLVPTSSNTYELAIVIASITLNLRHSVVHVVIRALSLSLQFNANQMHLNSGRKLEQNAAF